MSEELLRTLIITSGSILVALIGGGGITVGVRRQRRKRRAEVDEEERAAVAEYMADPGQWVKDVVASNKSYADEVRQLRDEVASLRARDEERESEKRTFRVALTRWMVRILADWGRTEQMPYPEGDDARILADVIPIALEATRPSHRSNISRTTEDYS